MPFYQPETAWETALDRMAGAGGRVGRKARRWLGERYTRRCLADFDRRVARLGPGSVCLDLGANVGTVTRKLAATGATVHAYEPDPLAFSELQRTLGHLPNVVLHPAAVAAVGGKARLRRRANFAADPLAHTITSTLGSHMPEWFDGGEEIAVDVIAFRDVLHAVGGPVALAKIDIEGSELDILRQILADPAAWNIDAIFCETHEFFDRSLAPEYQAMRRASEHLARPHINLYWP